MPGLFCGEKQDVLRGLILNLKHPQHFKLPEQVTFAKNAEGKGGEAETRDFVEKFGLKSLNFRTRSNVQDPVPDDFRIFTMTRTDPIKEWWSMSLRGTTEEQLRARIAKDPERVAKLDEYNAWLSAYFERVKQERADLEAREGSATEATGMDSMH